MVIYKVKVRNPCVSYPRFKFEFIAIYTVIVSKIKIISGSGWAMPKYLNGFLIPQLTLETGHQELMVIDKKSHWEGRPMTFHMVWGTTIFF